jgi:hypothetical protein
LPVRAQFTAGSSAQLMLQPTGLSGSWPIMVSAVSMP